MGKNIKEVILQLYKFSFVLKMIPAKSEIDLATQGYVLEIRSSNE